MKVKVNEKCIGCGTCVSLTDAKIFDYNDDGKACSIVDTVPEDMKSTVEQCINFCPADGGGAIEVVDGE